MVTDLENAARQALEASLHDDGKWYWVRYEGLGKTYEAPALYRESAKAFYSVEFSGIPARQVEVLCEYPLAQPQQEQLYAGYCANCGKPESQAQACLSDYSEEGEWFCSQECKDQHDELGCPHEHHIGYRHPQEAQRLIDCENALRSLASWLGVGGYNAPTVDAKVFEEKIRSGVEHFTQPPARKPTVDDDSQDWRGMDGAIAWHLIDRHADGWSDVGKMMGEWLEANQTQPAQQEPVGEIGKVVMFGGDLKEVSWKNGKMPPVGSILYTRPQARDPLTIEQEREAFESHWYTFYHSGSIHARSDGSYAHPAVQKAWEAWQARAAHGIKERA